MRFPFRLVLVGATFLLSVLLYVDRVCISAAKKEVAEDLSLSDLQMGWVFAAFSLGYALFQTPGGMLVDRFGPRRMLAAIVAVWSLFTGLTAAAGSYVSMLVVRFLFGVGEAGAFPGMARATFSWIPMQERGIVQGVNFSGSRLGAALTLPGVAALIAEFGWRPTFVTLMLVGFVWSAVWFILFRDDPEDVSWLGDQERAFILANRQSPSNGAPQGEGGDEERGEPFSRTMFRSSNVRALCVQYFASNFIFFFGLTCYFPQLMTRYGLTGIQASLFTAMPMLFGALGNWVSGWWIDRLYSHGKWQTSRRLPAATGFGLAAIGIVGSAHATSPLSSSLWFSLCIFGADMTLAPSWSTCVDIGESRSGVVSGTMNMAGNIGAFLTSLAFPYLLEWTSSPLPFFYVAAALNAVAISMWFSIDPTMPLREAAR